MLNNCSNNAGCVFLNSNIPKVNVCLFFFPPFGPDVFPPSPVIITPSLAFVNLDSFVNSGSSSFSTSFSGLNGNFVSLLIGSASCLSSNFLSPYLKI